MGKQKQIDVPGTTWQRPSGRWSAVGGQVTQDGRVVVSRKPLGTFDTEQQADKARLMHMLVEDRPATGPSDEETIVSEYLSGWLKLVVEDQEEKGEIARSTRRDYEQIVRNHLIPDLGHLRIGALDSMRVRSWIRRLRGKGLSDRTVQKVWRVLHRALEDADLARNPARLPKKDRPRVKVKKQVVRPTVEEVRAFLDHVADCGTKGGRDLLPVWRLMATTGLRRSEACGLVWGDVEVDNGSPVVTISRGLHPEGRTLYVGPPKSLESYRTIGLREDLAEMLRAGRASRSTATPVPVEGSDQPLDFIFRWGQGLAPLNPDTVTRAFAREWHHADLRPGVTLHGLRHSYGSAMLAEGLPFTEVAAHMGHSPQVLMTIYARDLDEAGRLDRMRAVTEELYG